jgi:cobalt/nickel transport system permease protein
MDALLAMHAPDGFLTGPTALVTGLLTVAVVGFALSRASEELREKAVPLAGVAAAFIFAAQMFNFPVAAGTTGHLMGGALAAVLLGPSVGAVVVTVVVVVQALVFADGGLTALGYNTMNMAIVTSFGGYAAYLGLRRLLPANRAGVVGAAGLAGGISVVLSAISFSLMWLFGASAPVPFDTVFGAMVGVHVLIGIGEGVLTGMAVGAVMASRPDLVYGARDLDPAVLRSGEKVGMRPFVIGGVVVALAFGAIVSQFAVDDPDGLESVAEETGFVDQGTDSAVAGSPFADYATTGLDNETVSLAVAGITGTLLTLAVGYGVVAAARGGRRRSTAT